MLSIGYPLPPPPPPLQFMLLINVGIQALNRLNLFALFAKTLGMEENEQEGKAQRLKPFPDKRPVTR